VTVTLPLWTVAVIIVVVAFAAGSVGWFWGYERGNRRWR